MNYKLIRSNRRSLSLEVKEGGLVVRAPLRASAAEIDTFIASHKRWIEKHISKSEEQRRKAEEDPIGPEELRALADLARRVIPERVRYYAAKAQVTYGRITIRSQRSKWGSCSSKGNLNFNCLLMLTPPEVIDSVVVHELCHRKEMNHSDRFYAEVLRIYPDYRKWRKWLKDNGSQLMARMKAGRLDP